MVTFKIRNADTLKSSSVDPAYLWPSDVLDEIDDDAFAEAIAAGRLLDPEASVTAAA
jgi:hypothetical protein